MKKKTRKKMNKKKKIIIIAIIVLIVFIGLIALLKVHQDNQEISSVNDANSLQQVIEFCECEFISSKESDVDGYTMDIYMKFKYDPYQDGQTKQPFYDVTISAIENYLSYRNIRLIDESRNLTIRVETNSSSILNKYFNDVDESTYFNQLISQANLANKETLEETNFNVNNELQTLVNNEWKTENINFGNRTSTFRNYDIYFDNGYQIRNIDGKIFNIIFTKKFGREVINNIKVGDSFDDIKESLGDNYLENNGILEYMGKDMYVCFSTDEISIYPRISYDYTSFEKIVEQYNEDHDFNSFMNKLTNIWPDYSSYQYDTNYCKIYYPLKGVLIDNSANAMNGIQIYLEYQGSFKDDHKNYYQVYYKTNDSLIIEQEINRKLLLSDCANITNGSYSSTKYVMKADFTTDGLISNISFVSLDGENADSELSKNIYASKTYWYDDDNLIYSVNKKGIYMYNATTRETKTLVSGTDNYDITNFDNTNKVLTYDGKDVKIEN